MDQRSSVQSDLKDQQNKLKKLLGEQDGRIQNLQSSAFQLANYYFVFQGVVFAAISNTTTLTCSDAWFVFVISLVAAVLNIVALFFISRSYIRAKDTYDETWSECNKLGLLLENTNTSQNDNNAAQSELTSSPLISGESSQKQSPTNGAGRTEDITQQNSGARRKRYAVMAVCMALLLLFTVVVLSGPWVIICKHDKSRRDIIKRDKSNCVKLCNGYTCMLFCHAES